MRTPLLAGLLCLSITGATVAAGLSLKHEMKSVVEPASNALFAVGGEVDPANGPDAAKVPEARWQEGLKAAQALTAVAADLNGAQRKAEPEWTQAAGDFARLAAAAETAALAKDGAGFSTAANALADTCTACHTKYKPKT